MNTVFAAIGHYRLLSILLIGIILSGTKLANAQNSIISGSVVDFNTKETLPFANIFINNTTLGTAADFNGKFELRNVPMGIHELIVSYVGYESIKASIIINDQSVDLGTIELNQAEQELAEVQIKGTVDTNWEKQLKRFKKIFLGEDDLADQCEILNPYVIDFSKESGGVLTASAKEPIEISNYSLGYKLSFHLSHFEADKESYSIQGQVRFAEISTKGGVTALQWMNNREESYIGSQQHLFRTILENRIRGEGYYLYTDNEGHEYSKVRSANFLLELGNSIIPYDTTSIVFPGVTPNTFKILMRGRIEVHCRAEESQQRTYNDIPYQVSWIEVDGDTVVVNSNGSVLNPGAIVTSGAMNTSRVASMLPLNYKPGKIIQIKKERKGIEASRVEENVYVHTDKPYYYPGEMLWMKAYINYRYPEKRDTMSRTLHVELINSYHKIVASHALRIDNGFSNGNWVLTDTLSSGTYYLRAYTNLNRNFDDDFFIKPLTILNKTEQVDPSEFFLEPDTSSRVSVNYNQQIFKTRDSIGLELKVVNQMGEPVKANLSISVTDARQVLPVRDDSNIIKNFRFHSAPSNDIMEEVAFPVEYGISYQGQYFNKKGKPEKATLSILQGNFEHLSVIETDDSGRFVESGLVFYDSSDFRFQTKNVKKKYDGHIEIIEREIPSLDFEFPPYTLKINETGRNQRIISEYEVPRGARLLSEVFIRGKRETFEQVRPYGKPDYVIKADALDISSNNLLQILQGKVPGLIITNHFDETGPHTVVRIARASGLTINAQSEPLVMIDNVPMSGRAGDILQSINAYTVESIEVVTRVSPSYGSAGVNGVISVYTKRGVSSNYIPPDNVLQTIKLKGYTRPDFFRVPNYSNKNADTNQTDYRSILYWNPNLTTDESGIGYCSFYAADLETRYRVVIEGITEDNEPVREVQYISVSQIKN